VRGLGGKMALRRRGCRPEGCDTDDIFGAGAQAALLSRRRGSAAHGNGYLHSADKGADAHINPFQQISELRPVA
jgi:hypothetical protein